MMLLSWLLTSKTTKLILLDSLLQEIMSDVEDNDHDERQSPRAGSSGVERGAAPEPQDGSVDFANLQDLIELTREGFNGSGSTGLTQDDMELTSKNKWLVIDPSYYPKSPGNDFFFKLSDWTDAEHARFTYGLLSGTKNYIVSNTNQTSFASIMNDPNSAENKEFKMFSGSLYAMSLVHMLAIDLHASLKANFPGRMEGNVDEDEVERNYTASLARHTAIYDENAKGIREAHESWSADRESAMTKVRAALERRRNIAAEDDPMAKLKKDLIAAHKSKNITGKTDLKAFIKNWVLDHYPTLYTMAQIPKGALKSVSFSLKRRRGDDDEDEPLEESYNRWADEWIHLCVRELTEEESLSAALRNISFLTQIEVNFNFSHESSLEDELRKNEDNRANSAPDKNTYRAISGTAYEKSLSDAYNKLSLEERVIVCEGSIKSASIPQQDKVTTDEVNKVLPFLGNKNFGRIARYMVVLSKLHWFRTNHHVGTDKEGIAKSLQDALERALRAMPVDDPNITENDIRVFFVKHLYTLAHWASTHLICGGLYMPSQKLISGYYHWVRHPRLVQKISPEDDLRRRLSSAPSNLAKPYLVTAIATTYISSPGWGVYSIMQLREIRDTVQRMTAIQHRAKLNLDHNRLKIDSAESCALFRCFMSCRKDERYAYHTAHNFMNLDSQMVIPECRSIGLAGMLVCAMHPSSTIARAHCFIPDGTKKITDVGLFGRDRERIKEMNTSLAGYDESVFAKLRRLALAMESSTAKNVRQLSHRIQFSAESASEVGQLARSLGMGDESAQILAAQMAEYLQDNTRSYEGARLSEITQDNEEQDSVSEEID